jgi:hypothetical protein
LGRRIAGRKALSGRLVDSLVVSHLVVTALVVAIPIGAIGLRVSTVLCDSLRCVAIAAFVVVGFHDFLEWKDVAINVINCARRIGDTEHSSRTGGDLASAPDACVDVQTKEETDFNGANGTERSNNNSSFCSARFLSINVR